MTAEDADDADDADDAETCAACHQLTYREFPDEVPAHGMCWRCASDALDALRTEDDDATAILTALAARGCEGASADVMTCNPTGGASKFYCLPCRARFLLRD